MNIFTALFGIALVAAQHWSYGWHPGNEAFLPNFRRLLTGKRSPNYVEVPDYYYGPAKLGCSLKFNLVENFKNRKNFFPTSELS